MNDKICNHCGTTKNLLIDKIGRIYSICKSCKSRIMSEKTSGVNHPMYGKHPSSEARKNMSLSQKGPRKPHSEETKLKIKMSNLGKINSEEHRLKISIAKQGIKLPSRKYESRIKNSKTQKHTIEYYKEKYPFLFIREELREAPFEMYKSCLQGICKNCNNWFTLTALEVSKRVRSLERNSDTNYFYCSNECKHSCSLFGAKESILLKQFEEVDNISQSEYQTFRKEVLTRQLSQENICYNHCEICNSEQNLHIHHEHPVKTHPHLALDPDNGIILCKECHHEIGHQGECSTGALSNKICT